MNHPTRVKICGMKSAEDIAAAVSCGADAIGLITEVPVDTPRKISVDTASTLAASVPPFVDSVLVMMPDSSHQALEMIDRVRPDVVQIHCDICIDELNIIRDYSNVKLIRSFRLPPARPGQIAEDCENLSVPAADVKDLIANINSLAQTDSIQAALLDTGVKGRTGGTGMVHDWSVSKQIVESADVPVIVAGGLGPANVSQCVEQTAPFAVDTASGVEKNGRKDVQLIKAFIDAVRYME